MERQLLPGPGAPRFRFVDRPDAQEQLAAHVQRVWNGLSAEDAALLRNRLQRECAGDGLAFIDQLIATAWKFGAEAMHGAFLERRICRLCGCHQEKACVDADGEPCGWAARDLCTACVPLQRWPARLTTPPRPA